MSHGRAGSPEANPLVRAGLALADFSERWFPDAFVFALIAVVVTFVAALGAGEALLKLVRAFGDSLWVLVPFTMQMALVIVGGYVAAASPPVTALIRRLAAVPRSPRAAVASVAFFSMATALVSWGLSLVFTGLLVREVCQRIRRVDYRAIGAAAYLGLGSILALGLSSSAALMMATRSSIPPALLPITGVIPLRGTVFLWQSIVFALVLMGVSVLVAYFSCPSEEDAKTQEDFGIEYRPLTAAIEPPVKPADRLEHSRVLSWAVGLLGLAYVVVIEAPYVMAAANGFHVHLGWTVQIYNAAEALPNLLNPFWMLPLMGILSVRARELAGYAILQLLVHVPVVFLLCWFFARTLPYIPPTP